MQVSDEEIDIILEQVLDRYGYDFTNYTRASLKRRINRLYLIDKMTSFAEFLYRISNNEDYFNRFVEEITVNVTEMFRDPPFYKALREEVLPRVATYPHIRIWHAGCSTGEEVYSMAILLKEAGLLHKSLLYATDINPEVVEKMMRGFFPIQHMRHYSENYIASGGTHDFSSYYTANYDTARFDSSLSEKIIHSTHNLVSDRSFNEFHIVICRNVLIYFDKELQERVFSVMDESIAKLGFLCLGSKETIKFSKISANYQQLNSERIWKKVR